MDTIFIPALALLIVAVWGHAFAVREHAIKAARRCCDDLGLQLLDGSVALHSVHIDWHTRPLRVTRKYVVYISHDGTDRVALIMTIDGEVTTFSEP